MTAALTAPVGTEPTDATAAIEVLKPGIQTTVQDLAGRSGLWDVGVPPSGAFDDHTFALANIAVGNSDGEAGLECVMVGPVLRFTAESVICVVGAASGAVLDGVTVPPGVPTPVLAGAVLDMGKLTGPGMRGYLAVAGGIDVEPVLGSRSTFVLGKFGGLSGRALRRGDRLLLGPSGGMTHDVSALLPDLVSSWRLRVMLGPHGAPVHLTEDGAESMFATHWTVDHRSDRTGVRLVGPTPLWARTDGGEAGLHPSNVHDSAYPVGGIMLSGDTPVIVGPDGPSLGGFVVPCVVIGADRWILGQLRPGDAVQLVPVDLAEAEAASRARRATLAAWIDPHFVGAPAGMDQDGRNGTGGTEVDKLVHACQVDPRQTRGPLGLPAPLVALPPSGHLPDFTVRLAGDRHVLVEAGRPEFDLTVRMWVHLLADALRADRPAGVTEIVEGVRSVLVAVDDTLLPPAHLAALLADLAGRVADPTEVVLDVREVTLPIAFDHPQAHEAMQRYQKSVNPTAPWCPDNVEFIRRMNELDGRDEVFDIVSAATYLVVGLGDVYLGAPVAVPIDPRHRLVTTKYNPARTWTPQNAVGIGGIYLCVYGMEGPGGYQLIGRTVPVWRLLPDEPDRDPQPWLLRQFDRLRFVPVSSAELEDTRADILAGRSDLTTRPATFSLAEVAGIETVAAAEIHELRTKRQAAFAAERSAVGRMTGTMATSFLTPSISAEPTAVERVRIAYERIAAADRPEVWITLRPEAAVSADAAALDRRVAGGESLPLAGLLVAVKDNIDVAGLPTTAACPEFAYLPERTATAIVRLIEAGALVLGKTNLDQFATGLVGVRSPYGAVRCAWDPGRVSGGSSSGSSVAVALGIADIGIGTDTAGSGRVPAALHGLIGLKATLGLVPNTGVVPACVDYDCVTVLAQELSLARRALAVMTGPDDDDPRSRTWPSDVRFGGPATPRIAIPREEDLQPLEASYRTAFTLAVADLAASGCLVETVDISGMLEAARLLYDGAIVAERYSAVGNFLATMPAGADPTVSSIVLAAGKVAGPAVIDDLDALARARSAAARALAGYDGLLLPTTTEHPTIAAVQADPVGINRRMGTYTNFCNLLDMAAVAFPAGTADGAPFGVMMVVPAFQDQVALDLAARFLGLPPGDPLPSNGIELTVFGAHLRGQPLNRQLELLGARFVTTVETSDAYRLMALDTVPAKPGLVRVIPGQGAAIGGEKWLLSAAGLGTLLAELPAPMSLTSVELSDGSWVVGFGCSGEAALQGVDITGFGGWAAYLGTLGPTPGQ